jgi:hypothetical protein
MGKITMNRISIFAVAIVVGIGALIGATGSPVMSMGARVA